MNLYTRNASYFDSQQRSDKRFSKHPDTILNPANFDLDVFDRVHSTSFLDSRNFTRHLRVERNSKFFFSPFRDKLDRDGEKVDAWKSFRRGIREMVACIFPDKDRQRFLLSRWNNFVFFFLSIPARRRSPVAFSVMISFQFLLLSPFLLFLFILVFGATRKPSWHVFFVIDICGVILYEK